MTALFGIVSVSGPFTYAVALPPVRLAGVVPRTVTEFADVLVRMPFVRASVVALTALSRMTPLVLFTVKVVRGVAAGSSKPVVMLAAGEGAV